MKVGDIINTCLPYIIYVLLELRVGVEGELCAVSCTLVRADYHVQLVVVQEVLGRVSPEEHPCPPGVGGQLHLGGGVGPQGVSL